MTRSASRTVRVGSGSFATLVAGAQGLYYATTGRIRPIYVADAAVELALVAMWLWIGRHARGRRRAS